MKIPSKLKKAKSSINNTMINRGFDFEILTSSDANGNFYYYFHFKSRNQSIISDAIEALCVLEKSGLVFTAPLFNTYKTVIWVPFNQKLKYLIHSEKEVYELVSSKNCLKKIFEDFLEKIGFDV